MTEKKRLQAWIPSDLYETIVREGQGRTSDYVEELLRAGRALKQGEIVEAESLPVIRELVQTELRKTEARLRTDIRADVEQVTKESSQRQANRLAALSVQAVREAGLARRMLFAFIVRAVGEDFARAVLAGAREAVGSDLAGNKKGDPYQ